MLPLLLACASPDDTVVPTRFVYQLDVASFQDSDGDGIGDLQGVRWHLQHVRSLGATTVQLLPLEPGTDTGRLVPVGMGVDPALGTLDDLDDLAADLHAQGMRLEVQVPMLAIGRAHPWFQEALDGAGRIRVRRSGGDGWYPTGDGRYYYSSAGPGAADLDWDYPTLPADRARVLDPVAERVDGVVLVADGVADGVDAAGALLDALDSDGGPAGRGTVVQATSVEGLLPWTALGAVVDTPRLGAVEAAAAGGGLEGVKAVIEAWGDQVGATRPLLGDGGRSRLASRVEDADLRRTLLVLHLLGPGQPALYYGEELDLADATTEPVAAPWRAPMPWEHGDQCGFTAGQPWFTPDPACKVGVNAYDEARDPGSVLTLVRWVAGQRAALGDEDAEVIPVDAADVIAFLTGRLLVVGSVADEVRSVSFPALRGVDLVDASAVVDGVEVPARGWRVVRVDAWER